MPVAVARESKVVSRLTDESSLSVCVICWMRSDRCRGGSPIPLRAPRRNLAGPSEFQGCRCRRHLGNRTKHDFDRTGPGRVRADRRRGINGDPGDEIGRGATSRGEWRWGPSPAAAESGASTASKSASIESTSRLPNPFRQIVSGDTVEPQDRVLPHRKESTRSSSRKK